MIQKNRKKIERKMQIIKYHNLHPNYQPNRKKLPHDDSSSDSSATFLPEINFTSHFSERILRN